MRIKPDLDLCQGHAVCLQEAPEVFELDPDTHRVVVLQENPPEAAHEAVKRALKYCPTFALSLED